MCACVNVNPFGTPIMAFMLDRKYVVSSQKTKSDRNTPFASALGGSAASVVPGALGEISTRDEQRSGYRNAN